MQEFWLAAPPSQYAEHRVPCDKAIFLGTNPSSCVEVNTTSLSLFFRRHSTKREGLSADYADRDRQVETVFKYYMKNISTIKKFFKDFFVHEEKSTRTTRPDSYTK